MRAKLVFLLLLAAAALTLGWTVAHHPRLLIGPTPDDAQLAAVPHRLDSHFPSEIRVNLTGSPVRQVRIEIDGPYILRPVGGGRTLGRGDRLRPAEASRISSGFQIGDRALAVDSFEIVPERSPAVRIDDHQYRGRIRFFRQPGRKLIVVNVVPLEDYIASVVDGEMPATFPPAARQAQAIVARTYALFQIDAARSNPHFDVYSSTRSQTYPGYQYWGRDGRSYAGESDSSRRIAAQTAGMVCLCEGKIFCTYYNAVCGGRTADGLQVFDDSCPALRSVECSWCEDAELYRWTHKLPKRQASMLFKRYFTAQGKPFGSVTSIRPEAPRQPSGAPSESWSSNPREPNFELTDGKHRYYLSAVEVRRILPATVAPSLQFSAQLDGIQLIVQGRGHGHGVGLCQWGARGMSLEGHGPLQILAHYYPGSTVVSLK